MGWPRFRLIYIYLVKDINISSFIYYIHVY